MSYGWNKNEERGVKMAEDEKLLTEVEVEKKAIEFLLAKYYRSKIRFTDKQLITVEDVPIYCLQGIINMGMHSMWPRLVGDKSANTYDVKMELDARQGRVINYELR